MAVTCKVLCEDGQYRRATMRLNSKDRAFVRICKVGVPIIISGQVSEDRKKFSATGANAHWLQKPELEEKRVQSSPPKMTPIAHVPDKQLRSIRLSINVLEALDYAVKDALIEPTTNKAAQMTKVNACATRWLDYGEILTVEFDFENNTVQAIRPE
jgi:hypothetical protein